MSGLVPTADLAAIGLGAFFGAVSRYQAGRIAADYIARDPTTFGRFQGWHTAAINIGGSFILGGVTGAPLINNKPPSSSSLFKHAMLTDSAASTPFPRGLSPRAKLLFGVGFCGSFTTFSTYSVDIVTWISQGKTTKAVSYIMANNVGGVLAASLGLMLVKKVFGA
jgi:fluoride ion exporter CrcB/FEX